MSRYSDLNDISNDILRKMDLVANETLELMNKECDREMKIAYREFGTYQKNEIEAIFHDAVKQFYDSYTPSFYDRTEGLYDVLEIHTGQNGTVDYDSVDDLLNPSLMHQDRSGGDLYQKVFVGGWHGGAESGEGHPNPGTPYYRKPNPYYTYWGRGAENSAPPYEIFREELNAAEGGRIYDAFVRISNEHNDLAMKSVNRQVGSIMKRYFG